MSRAREIDDFLKFVQNECRGRNITITPEIIYGTLSNYGFNAEEIKIHCDNLFPLWIDRYKNSTNLRVFQTEKQPHFVQFENGRTSDSKHLKLYVSLSPNAYYEGANIIFDFIDRNNMKTASKVADQIRSDEIVLRMESTYDAEKLIEFINSNKYLVENARTTNPFLNREGVVGIGYDDLLSYNTTLSYFISDYLNKAKNPGYDDFVNYMNNKYINLFQNQLELNEFTHTDLFNSTLARLNRGFGMINNPELYAINNYRIVFASILNNVYEDSYKNLYGFMNESKEIYTKMAHVDKYQLLNEFIRFAYNKYNQDINILIKILSEYSNGNVNAITRDEGFREKFIYNINPNKIMDMTGNDLVSYVNTIANNSVGYQNTVYFDETQELDKPQDFNIFIEGLRETYNKYGDNQILGSFEKLLNGDFTVITNGEFGYRKYFTSKYDTNTLASLARQYLDTIVNGRTINLDTGFNQAVLDILKSDYGFTNGRTR